MALRSLVAVLLAGAVAPAAAAAQSPSPSTIWSFYSAQRAANGLPRATWDPAKADGCVKHLKYAALNPGGFDHGEDPGKPGYTPEGANSEGEVLNGGGSWSATTSPWENGPLHLAGLFHPLVVRGGGASDGQRNCMRLVEGRPPQRARFYSLPGPGVRNAPYESTTGRELPFHPSELAGLKGTVGNPILLWGFASGRVARLRSASVTGPGGRPVAVKRLGPTTRTPTGTWSQHMGTGTHALAPVSALEPGRTYTVRARWTTRARKPPVLRVFSFTTRSGSKTIELGASVSGATVTITTDQRAVGQTATLSVLVPRPDGAYNVSYERTAKITGPTTSVSLPPEELAGAKKVEVEIPPFVGADGVSYAPKPARADIGG